MSVDTRGREAGERAHAAVDRIDLPYASAVVARRQRRRQSRFAVGAVASILVVTAGLVAVVEVARSPAPDRGVQVQPTTPVTPAPKATLEFRAVQLTVPVPASKAGNGCPDPSTLASPPAGEMFGDRTGQTCYILGPVILTGTGIDSATVNHDSAMDQWVVLLKWRDDEFITKIARPFVGKEIAIVSGGIVQSAPTINPGISGREVQVSGDFSRTDATNLAALTMGIAPSAVHVESH